MAAIGVAGSVARDEADAYSDLDVLVFWTRLDASWLCEARLGALGAERFVSNRADDAETWLEQYWLGGLKIDVGHATLDAQEQVFECVLERHETHARLFKNMAAVSDLRALYGEPEIESLRSRAQRYPEPLAQRMLEQYLWFMPPELHALCLERGDRLGYFAYLVQTAAHAIASVAALNGVYMHPEAELKGMFARLKALALGPERLALSLQRALEDPRPELMNDLREDLTCLVEHAEARFPTLSTKRARYLLGFRFEPAQPDS